MRTWLIIALLTAVALSGCAGEDPQDVDDAGPSDDGDAGGDGGNGTAGDASGSGGEATGNETDVESNTPPAGELTADVTNGTAPFNVTFTLEGSDEDGDDLSWTFDADGDGTFEAEGDGGDFPATYDHSYAQNGTYNATLTVSDGQNSTSQTVTINAIAAAGPAGPVQEYSGSFITSPYGCIANAWINSPATTGNVFLAFTPDPETYGLDFTVTFDTGDVPSEENLIQFWGGGNPVGEASGPDDVLEGTVPEGADTAYIATCGGGPEVSVTYTAG